MGRAQVYFTDRCAAIVHGKFYPAKTCARNTLIQRDEKNLNYTEDTGDWIFFYYLIEKFVTLREESRRSRTGTNTWNTCYGRQSGAPRKFIKSQRGASRRTLPLMK